ncbi:MAG: OadG-related small transporter subunit [Desulfomonilaceae bacterium]
MDKLTFGLTVLIVGISGTFLTLGVIILCTYLMKKIFPPDGGDTV